jgi:hypothetical protein
MPHARADESGAKCWEHGISLSGSGWMKPPALPLALKGGVPSYQVEDEEGRTHLRIYLPIGEQDEDRCCLWRSDHAGFASRSIFGTALAEQ